VSVALFLQRACLGGLHPERMNIKPNLLSLWSMMLAR
jgi:hypothetical protein